jgi:hypothetical protein
MFFRVRHGKCVINIIIGFFRITGLDLNSDQIPEIKYTLIAIFKDYLWEILTRLVFQKTPLGCGTDLATLITV